MPLITIMGPPASGKSSFAQYLQNYIFQQTSSTYSIQQPSSENTEKIISPLIISMNALSGDPTTLYDTDQHEKTTRSILKSRITAQLTQKRIIINDSLNEIKGFRFELFRFCQELGTRHVVVELKRNKRECLQNNEKERVLAGVEQQDTEQRPWDKDLLQQLVNRMEWADGNNRWDKPLFVLEDQWSNDEERDTQFASICENIWRALHDENARHTLRQPSNIAKDLSDTDTLYEIERATNRVVKQIMEMASTAIPGDAIQVCSESKEKFVYPRRGVSLMQLRRLRQQFIKMQQTANVKNLSEISQLFVIYLNNTYK